MIEILDAFKIEVESVDVHVGCATTLFKIKPKLGVKVSKIRNLKDEIAIALDVESVRVIPGKGAVYIEVPNEERKVLGIDQLLSSSEYTDNDMELPCAIGETITGKYLVADLAEMPHLLIAGATGQGKSVGLNTILMSLIQKKSWRDMQLILVDPKQVEFGVYSKLYPFYLARPVITDADYAYATLNDVVSAMETRYAILAAAGARNIREYNTGHPTSKMKYIVLVIDEYGDLVMQAGKETERLICRIAQKARAVGIHMILSTQRPSVTIVTGDIKANFPTRIAFRTTTSTDSRVVLGKTGAEKLTGMGDMLFFNNVGTIRAQCAYTPTEYVEEKVDELRFDYDNSEDVIEKRKRFEEFVTNTEPFMYAEHPESLKPASDNLKWVIRKLCITERMVITPERISIWTELGIDAGRQLIKELEDYGFLEPSGQYETRQMRKYYTYDEMNSALSGLESAYNAYHFCA